MIDKIHLKKNKYQHIIKKASLLYFGLFHDDNGGENMTSKIQVRQ